MAISLSNNKHTAAKVKARLKRQVRGRKKVAGTAERPRLVVTKSAKHLTVQLVDDQVGKTIAYASTMEADLRSFDGARISEKVRAELISRLPAGEPARADVAGVLNMSEKTLQRRLSDEDTSYQQVLDETRSELARQYLSERQLSVCDVTFRLGFSDQSSFTRAFKRWTGVSPGEFRNAKGLAA